MNVYLCRCRHCFFILLSIYSLCSSTTARAQEEDTAKENLLVISGRIDSSAEGIAELKVFPYFFEYRADLDAAFYDCATVNGYYTFTVPMNNPFCYVSLFYKNRPNPFTPIELYLAGAGDHIFIEQDGKHFSFSGRGSAKFSCQYAVNAIPVKLFRDEEQDYYTSLPPTYAYRQLASAKYDSVYNLKFDILDQYKGALEPAVYDQLKTDCLGEKLLTRFDGYHVVLSLTTDAALKADAIRYYRDSFWRKDYSLYPAANIVRSKTYGDALVAKLEADLRLEVNHFKGWDQRPAHAQYYRYITQHYTGALREKLLTTCFAEVFKGTPSDALLLNKALAIVKTPYYRDILLHLKQSMLAGRPAFPFSLQDTTGVMVKLDRFKGKALVMDFWFKGCASCARLEAYMKVFRKRYTGDSNLVFVSVNVDEQKQYWMGALQSGLYTDKEEINLNTGGKGVNHPLLQYYQYQSMPQLLIIDRRHKIVSAQPEPPVTKELEESFAALIEKAMHPQ